ncbi:hypothetical protein HBH49_133440 [Parastagonospora nodorum]|nr:hypothetical protein HBH49_133440 [Parastagonospora nodorum]KAH6440453.1 hypothetical protein HBI59_131990 [Parastagonospora nodorum]
MSNRYAFGEIDPFLNNDNPIPNFLTGMIRCEPWPDLSAINAGQDVFGTGIEYVYNDIGAKVRRQSCRSRSFELHNSSSTGSGRLVRRMAIVGRTMEIGLHDHFVRLLHMVLHQGMTKTEAQRAFRDVHDLVDGSLTVRRMRLAVNTDI